MRHSNDLAVSSSGSSSLDAERGSMARLADAGDYLLAEVSPQSLAKADGGGALALSQRSRVHASHAYCAR